MRRRSRLHLGKIARAAQLLSKQLARCYKLILCRSRQLQVEQQRVEHPKFTQESHRLLRRTRTARQQGTHVLLGASMAIEAGSSEQEEGGDCERRPDVSGDPAMPSAQLRASAQHQRVTVSITWL